MNSLLQKLCSAPLPAEGIAADSPLAPRPAEAVQKLNYSHLAMAKVIAANPAISQDELALMFGYSPTWISRVMSTEAFQHLLAQEMENMPFSAEMRTSTRLKIQGLMDRSIEILSRKLDKPIEEIPDQLAVQTFKATAVALEERAPPASPAQVHIHLEELGQNLVGLLRRRRAEVSDAEVIPSSPPGISPAEGPSQPSAAGVQSESGGSL